MTGGRALPTRVEPPGPGRPWTVLQLVLWSAGYLVDKGVRSGRLDAEYLLAEVLELDRLQLYLQFERPLDPRELAAFKPLLLRRANREPLQYILGRVSFRGIELTVDRRALIPRPETEELVDLVLGWVSERVASASAQAGGDGASRVEPTPFLSALDLGTGTGAIALALAVEGCFTRIVATDASSEALSLARENAHRIAVEHGEGLPAVDFRQGDLFGAVDGERYDVIVSNPPYVDSREEGLLQEEVGEWEPPEALFAGVGGLEVVRRILQEGGAHLNPGGLLVLEIGAEQGAAVLEIPSPELVNKRIARDLSGRDRFLVAERLVSNLKGRPDG